MLGLSWFGILWVCIFIVISSCAVYLVSKGKGLCSLSGFASAMLLIASPVLFMILGIMRESQIRAAAKAKNLVECLTVANSTSSTMMYYVHQESLCFSRVIKAVLAPGESIQFKISRNCSHKSAKCKFPNFSRGGYCVLHSLDVSSLGEDEITKLSNCNGKELVQLLKTREKYNRLVSAEE